MVAENLSLPLVGGLAVPASPVTLDDNCLIMLKGTPLLVEDTEVGWQRRWVYSGVLVATTLYLY